MKTPGEKTGVAGITFLYNGRMRLDRLLANSGYGSRTEIKTLIRGGRVAWDGGVVKDAGLDVRDEDRGRILIDGRPALIRRCYYLMMDKPGGFITAMDDPKHRTVAELIPAAYGHADLFPVGRLDRDTTGLLLLTNDGTLGHRLASPRFGVEKVYSVTIEGNPFNDDRDPALFASGLILADGLVCKPAAIRIFSPVTAWLTIHEGKYHQVKRMMAATGRTVTALRRLTLGPLQLDETLGPGGVRDLTEDEIESLYTTVQLNRPE